jgi:hypothetical protein
MVEIEIGVLRGQCLDRRIDCKEQLEAEIAAWERQRNASGARIKWMFTTDKARAKMDRAYPVSVDSSRSTEKSWPHFRPSAVDFCGSRLAIGAATERARALAMPAGTRAQALQTRL